MNENDLLFYLAFAINAGAISYAATSQVAWEFRRAGRQIKKEYEREFGSKAPDYLFRREVRDQLNARREMRR